MRRLVFLANRKLGNRRSSSHPKRWMKVVRLGLNVRENFRKLEENLAVVKVNYVLNVFVNV